VDNERHAMKGRRLNSKEVSERVGLASETLTRHYFQGKNGKPPLIKAYKNNPYSQQSNWFVYEEDLNEYMRACENQEG
jgi:hypothetical protein